MKFTILAGLAAAMLLGMSRDAAAQINVSSRLSRDVYLLYEPIHIEIGLTNYSARPVKLAAAGGKPWLQVMVTKPSGVMVTAIAEIPAEDVTVESGKTLWRRFDLCQLFQLSTAGQYVAHVRVLSPGGKDTQIVPQPFIVATGVSLWEDTVGIEVKRPAKGSAPATSEEQFRTYSLIQFSMKGSGNVLYAQVEDKTKDLVYGTFPLGTFLPFFKPQARVDNLKNLHLLYQTGSRLFQYICVDTNAQVTEQFALTNMLSSPRLEGNDEGRIVVTGGERQTPQER